MSIPSIPGYLAPPRRDTLADLWQQPSGEYPDALWPIEDLRSINPAPADWLVIERHSFSDACEDNRGCVLVHPDDAAAALEDTTWRGRDVGVVGVWGNGRLENGLETTDEDLRFEFLVHARTPSGASLPIIEISHPFLWYWDAFPTASGWQYLNRAGRQQDLIRYEVTEGSWQVEVRALEFRQFLAAYERHALIQVDVIPRLDHPEFERTDDTFHNDWAHLDFHAVYEPAMSNHPAFSRLLGQYLITGMRNRRAPRFEEYNHDVEYPTFVYKLDPKTGQPQKHTCDPDQLGTYFDPDGSRVHYLTPIYFKREVLQPYIAEPTRYRLSSSRLECLNLWGVDISFNSIGLVELYLGDLGKKLPPDEWGHWRAYNVPPEGKMDEGRFRRDFLGQWASSKDISGDLRRARTTAVAVSQSLFGTPLWKELGVETKAEFESLIGPLNNDPTSLGAPLLTLTKVLVDGIDPGPLKAQLPTRESGEQSLSLLRRYAEQLGDTSDTTAILRELQRFRSKGGIAHLAGSSAKTAKTDLGIDGMTNLEAFESIATRITACLNRLTELMTEATATTTMP